VNGFLLNLIYVFLFKKIEKSMKTINMVFEIVITVIFLSNFYLKIYQILFFKNLILILYCQNHPKIFLKNDLK